MPRLTARAYAKINWTLEVLGRREDGYHDIASVMSTVSLWDRLTLFPDVAWRFHVAAPQRLREEIEHSANLVPRAIAVYAAELARRQGDESATPAWPPREPPPFSVLLDKRIPAAAGLGGGSSDAAAALLLMRRAWRQLAPRDQELLVRLATRLGSDVPFFLTGGTALVEGRGEQITPLGNLPEQWLVVLIPPIAVDQKTARLYSLLRPEHFSDGARTAALAHRLTEAAPLPITDDEMCNTFEAVAVDAFPGIDDARALLRRVTGAPVHLSGAGPSLFARCESRAAARWAAQRLRQEGHQAMAVRPIAPRPSRGMRVP